MELRDIEIFLTLAEELHFGRTAERLRVSQARVSQAISKQERRLGVALFDRTSRRVALTPVGRRLREDLQQALDLIKAGLARAEAAGLRTGQTLRLGVFGHAAHELRPLVDAFRARCPGGDVQFGEIYGSDPFTALRTGEHDVNVLWLPIAEPDLTVGPTVLTGAACWPCRRTIRSPGAAPRPWRTSPTTMSSTSAPAPRVLGRVHGPHAYTARPPYPARPAARTFHEILSLVASGQCVHPLGEIAARYNRPPGVVFLPIHDAPALHWALTWRSTADNPAIHVLAQTAADLGPISL